MTYVGSVKTPGGKLNKAVIVQSVVFKGPTSLPLSKVRVWRLWTAEVKRLSAPQQKQLMFPNNQGLVGGSQRRHDRARGGWNRILPSSLTSIFVPSSQSSSRQSGGIQV